MLKAHLARQTKCADTEPMPPEHDPNDPSSGAPPAGRIRFNYVKPADYRSYHVDGVIGGLTPHGFVQLSVYAERGAIARITEHEVGPDGRLGPQIVVDAKDGLIREVQACLYLSFATAVELRNWLSERISEHESRTERPTAGEP